MTLATEVRMQRWDVPPGQAPHRRQLPTAIGCSAYRLADSANGRILKLSQDLLLHRLESIAACEIRAAVILWLPGLVLQISFQHCYITASYSTVWIWICSLIDRLAPGMQLYFSTLLMSPTTCRLAALTTTRPDIAQGSNLAQTYIQIIPSFFFVITKVKKLNTLYKQYAVPFPRQPQSVIIGMAPHTFITSHFIISRQTPTIHPE